MRSTYACIHPISRPGRSTQSVALSLYYVSLSAAYRPPPQPTPRPPWPVRCRASGARTETTTDTGDGRTAGPHTTHHIPALCAEYMNYVFGNFNRITPTRSPLGASFPAALVGLTCLTATATASDHTASHRPTSNTTTDNTTRNTDTKPAKLLCTASCHSTLFRFQHCLANCHLPPVAPFPKPLTLLSQLPLSIRSRAPAGSIVPGQPLKSTPALPPSPSPSPHPSLINNILPSILYDHSTIAHHHRRRPQAQRARYLDAPLHHFLAKPTFPLALHARVHVKTS